MDTRHVVERNWPMRWAVLAISIHVLWGGVVGAQTNLSAPANLAALQAVRPAVVSGLSAAVTGQGTWVRWQTVSEMGVLSFVLYRADGLGQWRKVNAEIVVADNSLAGGSYEVIDPQAPAGQQVVYKLAGMDAENREHDLGIFPVVPTALMAEETAVTKGVAAPTSLHILAESPVVSASLSAGALDGNTFIKITTTNGGMQILTASVLASALGDTLTNVQNAIDQRQFRLANRGQAVGYLSVSNGAALLFYALPYKDNYTQRNVFWLTSGAASPLGESDGGSPAANLDAAHYPAVLLREIDSQIDTSLPPTPEEDFWMWRRFVAGTGIDNFTDRPVLDRVASSPELGAQLSFDFWGLNTTNHFIEIKVNGQVVTNADWLGKSPFHLALAIPSTLLTNGSNQVVFKSLTNSFTSTSQSFLNRYSITYPRQFYAQAGRLEFTANSNSVISLNGFSNPAVTVLEVSNPHVPIVVSNLNIEAVSTNYRVSLVPSAPGARYVAFQTGTGTPVASVALAEMTGLASGTNAANYVLVTPDSLMAAATNLAGYRQQTGWQTRIARLEPIYNEFADGFVTPRAIQRFLAMAYTNWSQPPRSVVLLGDGTYDYRNLQGAGDNVTPPLLIRTAFGLFASDITYGDVGGDGTPELAVGRLTGNNLSEVTFLINKIKTYEAQAEPGAARSLLIADPPDFTAGDFEAGMHQVATILSNKFESVVLRRRDQPDANAMTVAITNTWNQGVDLVNYAGHGAIDRFGTEGYFTSPHVTNLVSSRIPAVIAITCVAGQFSVPNSDCLGEFLLRQPSGGAIAVVAPTGLSFNHEAMQLNLRLAQLFKENTLAGLGDIFRQAMGDHLQQDHPSQPTGIYNLLGDPAMRYNVVRDLRVTGITVTNQMLSISWTGGRPPFQLERKLALDAPWIPLGAAASITNALVPLDEPAAFFRIHWE